MERVATCLIFLGLFKVQLVQLQLQVDLRADKLTSLLSSPGGTGTFGMRGTASMSGGVGLNVDSAVNEDAVAKKMADKLTSLLSSPGGTGTSGMRGTASMSGGVGLEGAMFPDREFPRRPVLPRPYKNKVDLLFVLDSSGSIGSSNFQGAKRASKTIVDFVNKKAASISSFGSRVGLIEFSEPRKTHVEFSFNRYNSASAVKSAIDRVSYDSGSSTATAPALKLAKTEFDANGKSGHAKIVWTVTDGQSNTGGNPKYPADTLKARNTAMCVVGVGNIDRQELNDIADGDCVFFVESWVQYESVVRKALGAVELEAPKVGSGFFSGLHF